MSNLEILKSRFGRRRGASRSPNCRIEVTVTLAIARDLRLLRFMTGMSASGIVSACVHASLKHMLDEARQSMTPEAWNAGMERFNASEKA